MKKTLTAGLVIAGVLAVSGVSFAEINTSVLRNSRETRAAKTQSSKQKPSTPPQGFDGKRPPMMSRDEMPPMPPDKRHSGISRDRRPPLPPDDRYPRFSNDRRPPEFGRTTKQQGVQPK